MCTLHNSTCLYDVVGKAASRLKIRRSSLVEFYFGRTTWLSSVSCYWVPRQIGTPCSIENPWNSRIWEMSFMKALLKHEGVRLVRWDACMTGSQHKKSTGFLTNAPWIVDLLCDKLSNPHVHVPLEGKVTDYRPGASQDLI